MDAFEQESALAVQELVRRPLALKKRPPPSFGEKVCAAIFYGQLLVQMLGVTWMLASANVVRFQSSPDDCPTGYIPFEGHCVTPSLKADVEACVPVEPRLEELTARRLLSSQSAGTMWEMMADRIFMFGIIMPIVAIGLCAIWLFAMSRATATVVWGVLALNALVILYGAYLVKNYVLILYAVFIIVVAVLGRNKIKLAIAAIRMACQGLRETPSILTVSAGIKALSITYSVCFLMAATRSGKSMQPGPQCHISQLSLASKFFTRVCLLLFVITTAYFKNCVLAVCSVGIGCWYFPEHAQEEGIPPTSPSLIGAKLAFTASSGAVFMASLITGLVDFIRSRTQRNPCWWADPMTCIIRSLWCCLEGLLGGLSRFALITHMLHGRGLRQMAATTYGLLKRRLPDALTTSFVSEKVTSQVSTCIATTFGLATWVYLDSAEDHGFFSAVGSAVKETGQSGEAESLRSAQLLIVGLVFLMMILVRRPLPSIVIIFFVHNAFEIQVGLINAFSIAVLTGCIVAVIFSYFGILVEYAADTIFYCFALEAESGARQVRLKELYDIVEEQKAVEDNENNNQASKVSTTEESLQV